MSEPLSTLLSLLETYGYVALWIIVLLASGGVPIPTDPLLLATGAFAAHGDFNVATLALIYISAAGCGDSLGYLIGRKWGSKALDWLEESRLSKRLISAANLARARSIFGRYAGWAVFLTRFLVGALSGVINLLAGAQLYPYRSFLIYDVAGEAVDAAIMLGTGFAVGASWEAASQVLDSFSFLVVSLLLAAGLMVYLLRRSRRPKAEI